MAVKVHCSVCEKFIKDIHGKDISALTGKEICSECGDKIDGLFKNMEDAVADFIAKSKVEYEELQKRMVALTKAHSKYESDAKSLLTTMSAELRRRQRDLLGD